ncbi:natterin-3-like isoform X2 [Coccinella septempunctata]|uniref:natterin-3-like isoform X2 n=1 Tax=Coccinella septempunctata TaxID=41139 RepID=UPI001D06C123|nr:natterin-3-like isoform X2 [Coccinella septempunctata]
MYQRVLKIPPVHPAGSTSMGSPGLQWVNSYRGRPIPPNAVCCGVDKDGSQVYVGLANFAGDELPAKIVPRRSEAYVCHNGREIPITDYKVLVEKKLHWIHNVGGHIPPGAVPAGRTLSGEQLYVGRKKVAGSAMAVGKVHPSHGCLYVPFAGQEMSYRDYEILVYK